MSIPYDNNVLWFRDGGVSNPVHSRVGDTTLGVHVILGHAHWLLPIYIRGNSLTVKRVGEYVHVCDMCVYVHACVLYINLFVCVHACNVMSTQKQFLLLNQQIPLQYSKNHLCCQSATNRKRAQACRRYSKTKDSYIHYNLKCIHMLHSRQGIHDCNQPYFSK